MAYKSTLSSENIQEALDIIHSAVVIGGGILTLDNQSTSEQISSAIGGEDGFNNILDRIRGGNIALGIKVDDTTDNGIIMASIVAPKAENKFTISYLYKGTHYSDEFSLSGSTFSLSQTTEGGGLDSIFQDINYGDPLLPKDQTAVVYLTEEKYQEIHNAVIGNKIIRLIFACGVFYSVSALLSPNSGDAKVAKIVFGRAFTFNDDMSDIEEAKGWSYTVLFSENTDVDRVEPWKAIIVAEPDITKEFIEEIFTGNITTHTHDSTYVAQELETDVWDGTSISSSLSGSGTEADPYLIQSCADFAYLHSGNGGTFGTIPDNSFPIQVYFKFTKNLDFQDTAIPINPESLDSGMIYGGDYDGNGVTIYNFRENVLSNEGVTMNMGVIPPNYGGLIHGFNFKNYKSVINIDGYILAKDILYQYTALSPMIPLYSRIYDISINGEVILEGDLSAFVEDEPVLSILYILGISYLDVLNSDYSSQINPKTPFIIDLNVIDNTTNKGDKKIIFFYATYYDFNTLKIVISNPLDDSNIAISGELPPEKNLYKAFVASPLLSKVYTNSSGYNNCVSVSISEGTPTVVQSTPKTLDEMKSEEFANLLNSELPEARLIKDPEGGLPKIASLIPDFDGYVRKSIYDEQIKKIEDKVKEIVPVVYIPEEIADISSKSQQPSSIYNDFIDIVRNTTNEVWWKSLRSENYHIIYVSASNNIIVEFIYDNRIYKCVSSSDSSGDTWSMNVTFIQIGGGGVSADQVLLKNNASPYTPTGDYHPATKKYVDDNSVSSSEVLTKSNTSSYTPTSDYHPATKKYIDDLMQNIKPSEPSTTTDLSIPVFDSLDDAYAAKEEVLEKRIFIIKELQYDNEPFLSPDIDTTINNVLFLPKRIDYSNDYLFTFNVTRGYISCDFIYDIQNNTLSTSSYFINSHEDFDYNFIAGVSESPVLSRPTELTTINLPLSHETSYAIYKKIIIASFSRGELYVDIRWQDGTDPNFRQIVEKIRIDGLQKYNSVDNIIGFLFTYNNVRYIIKMDWDQGTATLDKIN